MKEYLHLHFIFRYKIKRESFYDDFTNRSCWCDTSNIFRVIYENVSLAIYCKSARTNFLHPATIVNSLLSLTHTLNIRIHTRTFSLSRTFIYFYFYLATISMIIRHDYSLRVSSVRTPWTYNYFKNAVLALVEKRSENRPTAPRRVLNLRRSIPRN